MAITASSPWTVGPLGGAIRFSSGEGAEDTSTTDVLRMTGSQSVAAWIKIDDFPPSYGMIAYIQSTTSQDYLELRAADASPDHIRFGVNSGGSGTNDLYTLYQPGIWYHVTAVYDDARNTREIYVNGKLTAAGTENCGSCAWSNPAGRMSTGFQSGFDYTLDDLRIYNRALSPAEIAECCSETAGGGVVTEGLVGWWKLDEVDGTDALDYASANHGTMMNGLDASTNFVDARIGPGLFYADNNDSLLVPDMIGSAPNITISLWAHSTGWATSGYNNMLNQAKDSGSDSVLGIVYNRSADQIQFEIRNASDTIVRPSYDAPPTNRWLHLVGVYDGSDAVLYVNGKEVDRVAQTGNIFSSTNVIGLGHKWRNGVYPAGSLGSYGYSNGTLDDVRIYDRALSAGEIAELYSAWDAHIRYNADYRVPEYFDGNNWRAMGKRKPDPKGLIGHWKLDEASGILADSSGYGNNGTASGGPEYASSGVVGYGMGFDGSDDGIDLGSPSALDFSGSNAFTLSAWAFSNGVGSNILFARGDFNAAASQEVYHLGRYLGNDRWRARISNGSGTVQIISPAATLEENVWQHMVMSWDGADLRLYKDAVEIGSVSNPGFLLWDGGGRPTAIGAETVGALEHSWNGRIDDVRIYNRALSADEIETLYEQNIKYTPTLTVRDYTLDAGLTKVEEVALFGNYAFVSVYTDETIRAIDISDPDNISLIGGTYITGANQVQGISIDGDNLFLCEGAPTQRVQIINISDPANMSVVGSIDTGVRCNDIAVVGEYAYLARALGNPVLHVYDVGNPSSPSFVTSVAIPNMGSGIAIAHHNGHLYIPPDGASAYLTSYSISNPAAPVFTDQLTAADFSVLAITQMRDLAFKDNYLFGAEKDGNGVFVVDISDPANMEVVAELPNNGADWLLNPEGIYIDGDILYVTAEGSDRLTLIDIRDPTSPQFLYSIQDATALDEADNVVVRNGFAYIGLASQGFAVVEVGNLCKNPEGREGRIIYNTSFNVMQYCDGQQWQRIGP
ncbi:MAG: LamG-like jellyroll fold domain-containing protein [Pseudomonadales bacterium]